MGKLFKINNETCKKHKNGLFDLGGGARFPKKFAQKLLATTVCIAMVLCTMPRGWGGYEANANVDIDVTLTVDFSKTPPEVRGVDELETHTGLTRVAINVTTIDPENPEWRILWTDGTGTTEMIGGGEPAQRTVTAASGCTRVALALWCDTHNASADFAGSDHFYVAAVPGLGAIFTRSAGSRARACSADVRLGLAMLFHDGRGGVEQLAYDSPAGVMGSSWTGVPAAVYIPPERLPVPLTSTSFRWVVDGTVTGYLDLTEIDWLNWPTAEDGGGGTQPPVEPGDDPGAEDDNYIEATVAVNGTQQRIRVYDPNGVLPAGTRLLAEAVTKHDTLDEDHEVEHLLAYNLSLVDADGEPVPMSLPQPVELWFEVIPGLDAKDLQVVLARLGEDIEFDEALKEADGKIWVVVKTNHFSPYALLDTRSADEKAAMQPQAPPPADHLPEENNRNVKTGDIVTTVTVASLSMVLVLALGVMLRLVKKNKFES